MQRILFVFLGLSFPSIALANLPGTNHSVMMRWLFLAAGFATLIWLFIVVIVFGIQRLRKTKVFLPWIMKIGLFVPVIILIAGMNYGKYMNYQEARRNNQCVVDCLACAPTSDRYPYSKQVPLVYSLGKYM